MTGAGQGYLDKAGLVQAPLPLMPSLTERPVLQEETVL